MSMAFEQLFEKRVIDIHLWASPLATTCRVAAG
jgi:hypothetical protein